jgi:dCTP deaminase
MPVTATRKSRGSTAHSDSDFTTFLLRCAAELFYRTSRVHAYVDELSGVVSTTNYLELTGYLRQRLDESLRSTQGLIRDALTDSRLEATRNVHLMDDLGTMATVFERENARLAQLPPLHPKPEMFSIEEAFRLVPRGKPIAVAAPAPREYSILLSGVFNAFEFAFDRGPGEPKTVLELGMCDFSSPPAWAILAHEIGHALDGAASDGRLSAAAVKKAFPRFSQQPAVEVLESWAEEIFCDFIAARVLGPAPMLALLSMEQCTFSIRSTIWSGRLEAVRRWAHPPTHWRALAVAGFLRHYRDSMLYLTGVAREFAHNASLRLVLQQSARKRTEYEERDRERFEKWFLPLAAALESIVLDQPLPSHFIANDSIQRCDHRLERGYPIGAQGEDRHYLDAALIGYFEDDTQRGVPRAFYQLARQFDEQPLGLPTILLAAHRRRRAIVEEYARDRLRLTDPEEVSTLCSRLAALDRTTELSIRMSGVHQHWLEQGGREASEEELAALATTPLTIHTRVPRQTPTVGSEQFLLSDFQIVRRLIAHRDDIFFVSPLLDTVTQVGPSSIDVRLGTILKVTRVAGSTHLDLSDPVEKLEAQLTAYFQKHQIAPDEAFVLHPGQFALATTLEFLRFPPDLAGRLEGRSTLARFGLQVHATAGFIDPGYAGTLTFELSNAGNLPIRIPPGYRLGQICLFRVDHVQVPYDRKLRRKYGDDPTGEHPMVRKEAEIIATSARLRRVEY